MKDIIDIVKNMIQFKSITPKDDGIVDYIISLIEPMGFKIKKYYFDNVLNLYALYRNDVGKNFCFAGHVDVVDPGNIEKWSSPPFEANIHNDILIGRGAVDMKSAIAAFISASKIIISKKEFRGSISILITSDEEDDSTRGMIPLLDALNSENVNIDLCLVGEPTSSSEVGDTIKIGRRGSVNFVLKTYGKQGHVAYPEFAVNPIYFLLNILIKLKYYNFDLDSKNFSKTNLEITSIDVGNNSNNVIPNEAVAKFNIRFNDLYNSNDLLKIVDNHCNEVTKSFSLDIISSCESFLTHNEDIIDLINSSILKITGKEPIISTGGGTSDARFIKNYCPVVEIGLLNETAHKIDEQVPIKDILLLEKIYTQILNDYFSI